MVNFFKKLFGGGADLAEVLARDAIILDVRTAHEFRIGHPEGAINLPLDRLQTKIEELQKKEVPVITCCASGRRSGIAAKRLKQEGIEAYNGGPWQRVQRYL